MEPLGHSKRLGAFLVQNAEALEREDEARMVRIEEIKDSLNVEKLVEQSGVVDTIRERLGKERKVSFDELHEAFLQADNGLPDIYKDILGIDYDDIMNSPLHEQHGFEFNPKRTESFWLLCKLMWDVLREIEQSLPFYNSAYAESHTYDNVNALCGKETQRWDVRAHRVDGSVLDVLKDSPLYEVQHILDVHGAGVDEVDVPIEGFWVTLRN